MHVLIIKNVFTEGPGTIADHLKTEKIPYAICDLSIGDAMPDPDSFTHLIIMGGPMAVYEMNRYPYLVNEARLINAAIRANKHVLGVCLGAQMVAHVLGAKVSPGRMKEIGWHEAALTPDGMSDPLMSALALPDRRCSSGTGTPLICRSIPRGRRRPTSSRTRPSGMPIGCTRSSFISK